MGSFALQIAKSFGATVTAVCSPRNLETARGLGADRLIDYTREDFTRSGSYDVIVDVAGNHSWSEYKRVLAPTGIMVAAGGSVTHGMGWEQHDTASHRRTHGVPWRYAKSRSLHREAQ